MNSRARPKSLAAPGLFLAGLFALPLAGGADEPRPSPPGPPAVDTAAIRERMRPLVRLDGCWKGVGRMRTGPGEPQVTEGTELVESRLGGTLVTVSGRFRSEGAADGEPGRVVHEAFAVIVPAPEGGFRFLTHLASGLGAEMRGDFVDGKFVWSPPAPPAGAGRRIRYVADWRAENRWHEVGEHSVDGVTWTQFLEMELARQPTEDACRNESAPAPAG